MCAHSVTFVVASLCLFYQQRFDYMACVPEAMLANTWSDNCTLEDE